MKPPIRLPRAPLGATGFVPAPEQWNEAMDTLERLDKFTGGVGIIISDGPGGKVVSAVPPNFGFWAKITGNSQNGSNFQWSYAWSQVAKTTASFGGWTVVSGGLSGTTSNNIGYNTIEDVNGASGLFGNGVNSSNLTGTLKLQPAANGAIVWMQQVTVVSSGTTTIEYQFQYENAIDGGC